MRVFSASVAFAMVAIWSGQAADFSAPARVVVRPDTRTGRLVRSVVVEPRQVPSILVPSHTPEKDRPAADVPAIVEQTARLHDVDPLLVHSVIPVPHGLLERPFLGMSGLRGSPFLNVS